MWFALGGDASLVVGIVTVRVITPLTLKFTPITRISKNSWNKLSSRLATVRSGPDRGLICRPLKKTGLYGPVTGQMCSDRGGRVRRMANRNYGGNGGRALIVAAQAAAQLN
jgi:hypothetical protein